MAKTPRLNDTEALQEIPPYSLERSESRSTRVRRIDNGYLTSQSSFKDGRLETSETFSATPPNMEEDKSESLMRRAVDYMKREGTL